jgi:hypothetical protein
MMATGHAKRSLQLAFFLAPTVVTSYGIGFRYGAEGVALGFSAAMLLLAFPTIHWATRGTVVSVRDILQQIWPPLCSILTGCAIAALLSPLTGAITSTILRLVIEVAILFCTYALMLIFAMRQRRVYANLFRELIGWRTVAVQV